MNCPRKIRDNRGAVLITMIIILIFLSVLGMSSITYLYSRLVKSNLELDRLKALYLAEAGIAQSIYELRKDKDPDHNGVGNVLRTALGGGFYKATHNFQASTIIGIGDFNNIRRSIQIKYRDI